jgi:signal transduction histidine kinase
MGIDYAYTPNIWPSILAVFLMLGLAIFSSRRTSIPGAIPLMIGSLLGAAWAAGSVLEYAATDLATKIFWVKFQTAWQLPAVTMVTCFVMEYAMPGRWLTRRNLALLSVAPLLVLSMILLDNRLHWIWASFTFDGSVVPQLAPGGWMAIIYSFVLVILNLITLIWLFQRSPQLRWVVVVIIIGQVGVRALYILEKADLVHSHLPLDVIGLAFIVLMYGIALFGFRIFDPIPLARRTVIEQLRDGVLVLDPQGRVASLNAAMERFLGVQQKQVIGRPVAEILPSATGLNFSPGSIVELSNPAELTLGSGAEAHCFELEASPLNDFHGLPVGFLLLLHDVTEQRRSQAQILGQQRALAALQEREKLARELHDNLGQVFGFVTTQGQASRQLLKRGEVSTADEYITRLVDVAREADVDIRESILGLQENLTKMGLFSALEQYLVKYSQHFGIHTELNKPESIEEGGFDPLVEVQLLRIIQEALTNIRKHANALNAEVKFERDDGWVRVIIKDDGNGFDPGTRMDEFGRHIGLRVMRERAEEIGGHLDLYTEVDKGTQVVVKVPIKRESVTL